MAHKIDISVFDRLLVETVVSLVRHGLGAGRVLLVFNGLADYPREILDDDRERRVRRGEIPRKVPACIKLAMVMHWRPP